MAQTDIWDVVRSCIFALLLDQEPTEQKMLAALDRLLSASHALGPGAPSDRELDGPKANYETQYKLVGERYPKCGFYNVADPLAPLTAAPMVADAIDDILDIAADLQEALWRSENVSVDEGIWYLGLMRFHWMTHARNLTTYLSVKQFV